MVAMEAPSPPGTGGQLGQFPSTSVSFCCRLGVNRGKLGDIQAFCYLLGKSGPVQWGQRLQWPGREAS